MIEQDEALRALGMEPERVVASQAMAGGLSGARLTRLTLRMPLAGGTAQWYASRVLKRYTPGTGWLGVNSHDTLARETRLARLVGLAPQSVVSPVVATATLGAEMAPTLAALMLRDARGRLLRRPLRAPGGRLPPLVGEIVARLAELHARFWEDAALTDPSLGLMDPLAALLLIAPETIARRLAAGDDAAYLPGAARGWEMFFRSARAEDAAALGAVLAEPERWMAAIARMPWTLVHGDVWGPNLGWAPAPRRAPRAGRRLLLLDWALATAGPATYDPLWLCGCWPALHPGRALALYRARLQARLAARGVALDGALWRRLADAGYLRTALCCGEAFGQAALNARPGRQRACAEARIRWWAARAARAAQRLAQNGVTGRRQDADRTQTGR